MVFLAGCMDAFASSLTHLPLDELPVLKTKSGFARKSSDQTNKLLVLDRVKKERLHRWRIAKTHCNLISEHCKLMKAEAYLSTVLHDRISAEAILRSSSAVSELGPFKLWWVRNPSWYGVLCWEEPCKLLACSTTEKALGQWPWWCPQRRWEERVLEEGGRLCGG